MSHTIKTLYIVHHSHTDIGYTDLQERIISAQVEHIRTAVRESEKPENREFRWNCETLYCVEQFWKEADDGEKEAFFRLVKEGRMGISGTYLNFNDLVDCKVLSDKLKELSAVLCAQGITMKTAMIADINGISMGQRDALLDNGVEFLFTNIHTHHGMYPLYQNQNAYWWEAASGKRLLVWNGEHYNLGNALGLQPAPVPNFMCLSYFGERWYDDALDALHEHIEAYLNECEEAGYSYDFLVSGVSGVFSDNAPPSTEILRVIEQYRSRFGKELELRMVSLQELYAEIGEKLKDAPVYRGDLNDWWANGVGSTPLAVKHYRAAGRMLRLARTLAPEVVQEHEDERKTAEDNLLLYAEHTWGHSATVTDPYETLVTDLDLRKTSYASKAHEAAARLCDRAVKKLGGTFNYYRVNGNIRAVNTGSYAGKLPVEFYIETMAVQGIQVTDEAGRELKAQLSAHPRGVRVSFVDEFGAGETKTYRYRRTEGPSAAINTRYAFAGAERVRDIVNDFDAESYRLPYCVENDWFRISYEVGKGLTSFWNKQAGCEMLSDGPDRFFTPIYERTALTLGAYENRRLLGRNIRGQHAEQFFGKLTDVTCTDKGEVFVALRFTFALEGTDHCELLLKMYRELPRVDFTLRLAKTLSDQIESVYLPLTLHMPGQEIWLEKGTEAFRPGVDQLPGTGMEYWMSDLGAACPADGGTALLYTPDVPLLYQGEMKHHPIVLCDQKAENNNRPLYSWIMNNTWETNFRMDLSGFGEYTYRLELTQEKNAQRALAEMSAKENGVFTYHTEKD